MQFDAIWCNLMQFDAIWCNLMQFDSNDSWILRSEGVPGGLQSLRGDNAMLFRRRLTWNAYRGNGGLDIRFSLPIGGHALSCGALNMVHSRRYQLPMLAPFCAVFVAKPKLKQYRKWFTSRGDPCVPDLRNVAEILQRYVPALAILPLFAAQKEMFGSFFSPVPSNIFAGGSSKRSICLCSKPINFQSHSTNSSS
jgi:hypothetical protein